MLLGSLNPKGLYPPTHSQYRRYWKVIEEFLIFKEVKVSQKTKQATHVMLKGYVGIESIASDRILKFRLTKYINQVEMILSREFGFILGETELKF